MKIKSKISFALFLVSLAGTIASTLTYINYGKVRHKYGVFFDESALLILIAYWSIVLTFGFFSFSLKKPSSDKISKNGENKKNRF